MAVTASELKVLISADTRSLESGLSSADRQVSGFAKSAGAMGSIATAAFVGLGAAAVGVGAGLGAAVGLASSFQATISEVGAVSGASGTQLQGLSALALQMGADTAFSAGEAAQAMAELAKGGIAVDQMASVLPGTLDLAAAGGLGLAEAATIATDSMSIFASQGVTMDQVANAFAGAANISSISVSDMASAMSYAGPAAAALGFSIEDTSAAIALLGANGIKGSSAGTGLRTVLTSLAAPTDKAAGLMKDLGLNFFDASGKMLDMSGISEQLKSKLGGMSDAQRIATLETLAGKEGMSTLIALMGEGDNSIQSYTEKLKNAATAHETGKAMMDNFAGSMDALKGSVETAGITLGLALLPVLRQVVDAATAGVNAAMPFIQAWGPQLAAGLQSGIGQAVVIVQSLGTAMMAAFNALRSGDFSNLFGPLITAVSTAFGPETAGKVTLFVSSLVTGLQTARDAVITAKQAFAGDWINSAAVSGPVAAIGVVFSTLGDVVRALQNPIATFDGWMGQLSTKFPVLAPLVGTLSNLFNQWAPTIGLVAAAFVGLGPALSLVGGILPTVVGAFSSFGPIISILSSTLPVVISLIGAIGAPLLLAGAAVAALAIAWSTNFMGIQTATMPVITAIVGFITGTLLPGLAQLGTFLMSTVVPAFVAGWAAIQAGVSAALTAVMPLVQQFIGFLTGSLLPGIQGIVAVAGPAFDTMKTAIVGAFQSALPGIQSFIGGVQQLGSAVLPIISSVASTIVGTLGPAIMAIVGWAQTVIPQFAAAFSNVMSIVGPLLGNLASLIGSTLSSIAGFISSHSAQITAVFQAAWNLISSIVGTAFALISGLISAGLQAISGNWSGAWATIQATAATVWSGIQSIVQAAITLVQSYITVGLQAAQAVALAVWTGIQSAASTAWSGIQTLVSNAAEAVRSAISTKFNEAKSAATTAFEGAKSAVSTAMSGMESAVSTGVGNVLGFFQGLPGKITGAVGNLSGLLVSAGKSVIQGFLDGINSMIGAVTSKLAELTSMIPNLKGPPAKDKVLLFENGQLIIRGLIDGIDSKIPALATQLGEVTDSIGTLLGEAVGTFGKISVGSDKTLTAVMRKVRDDIKQAFDTLTMGMQEAIERAQQNVSTAKGLKLEAEEYLANMEAVTAAFAKGAALQGIGPGSAPGKAGEGIGNSIAQGVRRALDINSPSKVMNEIGQQVMAGLAQGMDKDQSEAVSAAADAASKVAGAISSTFDALTKIGGFKQASFDGLYALGKGLRAAVNDFAMIADQVGIDAYTAAGALGEQLSKAVGAVSSGVDAFAKLATYASTPASAIYAFGKTVRLLVQDFAAIVDIVGVDVVTQAGVLGEALGKVTGGIGSAVSGLKDLLDFGGIPSSALDLFAGSVSAMISRMATIAGQLATTGIDAASALGAALDEVFSGLNAGTSFFKSLDGILLPDRAGVDRLLAPVLDTIGALTNAARGIAPTDLAAATSLASTIGNIFGALSTGNKGLTPSTAVASGGGSGGVTNIYQFTINDDGSGNLEDRVVAAIEMAQRRGRIV